MPNESPVEHAQLSVTHRGPTQTAPDIYAGHLEFAAGTYIQGTLHQWRLGYTLAGRCRMRTEQHDFMDEAGDLYFTHAQTWMSLLVCDAQGATIPSERPEWETAYAVFHPRPHWHAWLDALGFQHGVARLRFEGEARAEIETALLQLVHVYQTETVLRDELALLALESFLLTIYRHAAHRPHAPDSRIRAAIEFIHAHYRERLTGPAIARAAGLSVPHLATLFTDAVGMTPGQYLERVRLARAAEMLRFSVSNIGEIAFATGYPDPNYFARRFRLHYGQTPCEYRDASRP